MCSEVVVSRVLTLSREGDPPKILLIFCFFLLIFFSLNLVLVPQLLSIFWWLERMHRITAFKTKTLM